MECRNCRGKGRVALTNEFHQIYEFRNCPLCTCKACDGVGMVYTFGPDPSFGRKRFVPCEACRPDRFDAHVRLYKRKLAFDVELKVNPVYGDPSPEAFSRNVEQFVKLNQSPESYEDVYRRCLNPLERFCRWITHNPDGSKRK